MPTKIFTTIDGQCPFGRTCQTDSKECRTCDNYYRNGTGMFFWCKHPDGDKRVPIERKSPKMEQNAPGIEQPKRKRGRPPGKATKPAETASKRGSRPTKGKERPIRVIKQVKR